MAAILGKCKFHMMYLLINYVILSLYKEWKQNRSKHSKKTGICRAECLSFLMARKGGANPSQNGLTPYCHPN